MKREELELYTDYLISSSGFATATGLSGMREDGVLIFDDTIQEKAWTDENEVMCWHFDHCKGRSVKGINLLNALCLRCLRKTSKKAASCVSIRCN